MQRIFILTHNHRMPRIRTTVISNDAIIMLCQQINNFPFSFITPLQSGNGSMILMFRCMAHS